MSNYAKYTGTSDAQVRWGSNDDPRGVLTEGETYEVERRDVHSSYTKIKLVGIDGWFNSVCFDEGVENTIDKGEIIRYLKKEIYEIDKTVNEKGIKMSRYTLGYKVCLQDIIILLGGEL